MNLFLDMKTAVNYNSSSQKIRIMTEDWVQKNIYCPNCGREDVRQYSNNRPVADFYCEDCGDDYELKSKAGELGKKIIDGAYSSMIERLGCNKNPNFFFLSYRPDSYLINNFIIIPKHFFIPRVVEKRKPLSVNAKRAGWVGCNILLDRIPLSGRIFFIKNGKKIPKKRVLSDWQKTVFLRDEIDMTTKTWIMDVLECVDKISENEFTIDDVYKYDEYLKQKHPENKHIRDKIRQQLQFLRDKGYIEFVSRGVYKKVDSKN